ncbi:MAG: TonB-dependent receptor [Draconibacterium sp.]|nr:TonB-dependent receptor [Draconibacterium sp.]
MKKINRGKKERKRYLNFMEVSILTVFYLVFLSFSSLAQEKNVTGKVVDKKTQELLPGVTIVVEGTTNGTVTDVNGKYSINVKAEDAKLQFRFVGYETQVIEIGNQTVINIELPTLISDLDEVVVVGYGTMRKRDLTGAVSSVKGSSIEKANPISIQSALAGRVAGVQVTQTDNSPGAGIKILIRGGSSLTSGNQPLYVIDGFPIVPDDDPTSNPLADLSPSQIESMEILKDASATAIYGAEGANGVIIITTKLGKEGRPEIRVNASYGISDMAGYPGILSPDEFTDYMISKYEMNYFESDEYKNSLAYWQKIKESGEPGNVWIEDITRRAQSKNANINFSGGTNGMRYAVSGDYLNQEGIIDRSKFNRMNLNANLEQKIGEKIKIGTALKFSMSENSGMVNTWEENTIIKKALQTNPFMDSEFSLDDYEEDDDTYSWNNENVTEYIRDVDNQFETSRMIGNMFFQYEIIKGLNFYTSYGFNRYYKNEHSFFPTTTRKGLGVGGEANFKKRDTKSFVYQARLNYIKNIAKHHINATAVFETKSNEQLYYRSTVQGFGDESRGVYDLSSVSTPLVPSNIYSADALMSYLGRVSYNYNNRYLLTASLRADGSSKFGKENKWGYFPSIAAGWLMSEENFIKNMNTFDLLKLRVSFGVTGNNQIPSYSSLAKLTTEKYIFDDALYSGMVPGSIANPNLKWETTNQYNIGLDLGFFKNRVLLTAEAYYKETTDLLLDIQLPLTSGYSTALKNIGSISNKGLELTINTVNIDKKDWKWTSTFTISTNKSKVLDLGEPDEMFFTRNFYHRVKNDILVRVGDPIGIYYGYVEDQAVNSENEIANSPEMKILENIPGQVKIYDVNGDGIVTSADKVPLAKTVPDFVGGLSNEITYKNFDLSFFLRWSYGNDIINGNITFLDRMAGNWNTLRSMQSITFTPINTEGTFHGSVPNTYSNIMRSGYVEDGSFLKCDYITLGYRVPNKLLNKINIKNLRIYARVGNPFMITRYSWFDPEVSTGWGTVAKVGPGADVGTYPRATNYSLGLSIGL